MFCGKRGAAMVVQSPSYPHQKHGAISVLFTPKAGVNKHFLFEKHGIQGYQITFTFTFIYFLHILQGSSNFCRTQSVLYFLNAASSRISNMTFGFILNQNKKPIACGWSLVFSFGWKRNPLLSNLCFQLVPRDATAWRSLSQSNSLENWDFPHFPPTTTNPPKPTPNEKEGKFNCNICPSQTWGGQNPPLLFFPWGSVGRERINSTAGGPTKTKL